MSYSSATSSALSSDFSDWAPTSSHAEGEELEVDPAEARRRHEEFERKRLQHYNMRAALEKAKALLDSDEGEGDPLLDNEDDMMDAE
jgi:hypothetical protein